MRQLIAVIDPLRRNTGLIGLVVNVTSSWRHNSIGQLGWTPSIFNLTLGILDWSASNGIDNFSCGEVVNCRLRWCGGLTLLWTITVDVGNRLSGITSRSVLNWNRLLTVNQVNSNVLSTSTEAIWQEIITETICLRRIQLVALS